MKAYNIKRKPKHHIKPRWITGELPVSDIFGDSVEWFENHQLIGRNIKKPKNKRLIFNKIQIFRSFYIITENYKVVEKLRNLC